MSRPRPSSIIALALVALALSRAWGTRESACPPGLTCARWAQLSIDDVALSSEACLTRFSSDAAAVRRSGFNALAISVPLLTSLESDDPARPTLRSRARWLLRLARLADEQRVRLLAVLEDEGAAELDGTADRYAANDADRSGHSDASCSGTSLQSLELALLRERVWERGDAPPSSTAGQEQLRQAGLELYCPTRAATASGKPAVASAPPRTRTSGWLLEQLVSGDPPRRLAILSYADARRAGSTGAPRSGLSGYVVPSNDPPELIVNRDFALGWRAWETSGDVRLQRNEPTAAADQCLPLTAVLGPGSRLRQANLCRGWCRFLGNRGANTELLLSLTHDPASADLELDATVELSNGEAKPQKIELRAHTTQTTVRIGNPEALGAAIPDARVRAEGSQVTAQAPGGPPARTTDVIAVTLSAAGDLAESVPLRGVRFHAQEAESDGSQAQGNPFSTPQPRFAWQRNEQRLRPPVRLDRFGGVRSVSLLDQLDRARIQVEPGSSARLEVYRFNDVTHRSALLAHPGSTAPTRVSFPLPELPCIRRFVASVSIAPECQNLGDGALFRASAGTSSAIKRVASDGAGAGEIALDLDVDGHRNSGPLELSTSSGDAGDVSCDWALWVEPRIRCASADARAESAETDANRPRQEQIPLRAIRPFVRRDGTELRTHWDELNAWKLYTVFGPLAAVPTQQRTEPGWLARRIPWVSHIRILAATGGNTCSHISEACARSEHTPDHPFDRRCSEGLDGRAERYELLHDETDEHTLDLTTWTAALDDLLASGMLPHLNISAAPCALTEGHEYRIYHWNQRPVVDHEGWRQLLRAAAREVAKHPSWPDWRFSITNEPNCLWIAPPGGDPTRGPAIVNHIGFVGSSEQYASQLVESATEIWSILPKAQIHLGNFTVGGKLPLEDNLPEYLGALERHLSAAGTSANAFQALSLSLYETPQHRLADVPAEKLSRLARLRPPGSAFEQLPLKIDEAEIHPLVAEDFQLRAGVELDTTRWAAAWHAELIAVGIEAEASSIAPWLARLFSDLDMLVPHPKLYTYLLASVASGDLRFDGGESAAPGTGGHRLAPAQAELMAMPMGGGARLRRRGSDEPRHQLLAVRRAASDAQGIGYIATRDPVDQSLYLLIWRHSDPPTPDPVADREPPIRLSVDLPLAASRTQATAWILGSGSQAEGEPIEPVALAGPTLPARLRRQLLDATTGAIRLTLPSESVALVRVPAAR